MKVSAMKVSADLLESAEGFSKPGGGPDLIAPQSDSRGENLVLLKVFHDCRRVVKNRIRRCDPSLLKVSAMKVSAMKVSADLAEGFSRSGRSPQVEFGGRKIIYFPQWL